MSINLLPRSTDTVPVWIVLKRWRRELGLTLRQAGEALQLSYSSVRKRETPVTRYSAGHELYRNRNRENIRARSRTRYAFDKDHILAKSRENYAADRERRNMMIRIWRRSHNGEPAHRLRMIASNANGRARKHKLPLAPDLIKAVLAIDASHCACCGAEIDYTSRKGFTNRSPSLDRIDNDKGYTLDNVALICLWCNKLKRNATLEDLELLVTYMKKHPSIDKSLDGERL